MTTEANIAGDTLVTPSRKKAAAIGFLVIGGFGSILSFLAYLLATGLQKNKMTDADIAKFIAISFVVLGVIGAAIGCANPTWCAQRSSDFFRPEQTRSEATPLRDEHANSTIQIN